MISVSTGFGILAILYGLAALLVGGIIASAAGLGSHSLIPIGISEVVAAVALWFTGVRLNRDQRRQLDPRTGKVVFLARHTLFGLPMQYWAFVLGLIGVIMLRTALHT